jgi:hypothetical protein
MSMDDLIALSVFALDVPPPGPGGWPAELDRRDIPVVLDDIGRWSISRAAARDLLMENRENEARKARKAAVLERRAIEADQAFRESLPVGISAGVVPEGLSAAQLMMLSDPDREKSKRQTVVEHALANPAGAIVFHTVEGSASAGDAS